MAERAKKAGSEVKKAEDSSVQKAVPMRPVSPFDEMEDYMTRMFEGFVPRGWLRPVHWGHPMLRDFPHFEMKMPSVDVIEGDSDIVVKAELPGVNKEDLEVSVDENTVTLSGKTSHEEKETKGHYFRTEIRRGSFARTVTLPKAVDAAKAQASFKNGILELTLPKVEKSKRVSVKVL